MSILQRTLLGFGVAAVLALSAPARADGFAFGFSYGHGGYYPAYAPPAVVYDAPPVVVPAPVVRYYYPPAVVYPAYPRYYYRTYWYPGYRAYRPWGFGGHFYYSGHRHYRWHH